MALDPSYSRFFPNEPQHWQDFQGIIQKHSLEKGRVLDLGCGDNTSLERFRGLGRQVWGADFQAHPQLRHGEWFRRLGPGGEILFPSGFFDLVSASEVLEHVADPKRFLQEVFRVLAPGGWLVAHSINGNHYVTWIRRLLGLLPHWMVQRLVWALYGRPEHDTFPTYYRLNTPGQIKNQARRSGLNLVHFQYYADFGNYFCFFPRLRRWAVALDWLLEKAHLGLGRLYFTVLLQKPSASAQSFPVSLPTKVA